MSEPAKDETEAMAAIEAAMAEYERLRALECLVLLRDAGLSVTADADDPTNHRTLDYSLGFVLVR